jgi:deoxyadenosine/deoxycytidine kinase
MINTALAHKTQLPKLISIEGNIGAGKSTLVRTLQEKYKDDSRIVFLQEPVNVWESVKNAEGKTILQKFYEDPKKYAFSFQVLAFTTRLHNIQKAIATAPADCKAIIMERSLEADKYIFASMLHAGGTMDSIEYQIYKMYSQDALDAYKVDKIIWLSTPPKECGARIQKRKRDGEDDISMEYLETCHQYHYDWLIENNNCINIHDNTVDIDIYAIV